MKHTKNLCRTSLLLSSLSLLACGKGEGPVMSPADLVDVGDGGKYSKVAPPGESGPQHSNGKRVVPKVTKDFAQLPQTNDWWSGLIWNWDEKDRHSPPLYPHPMSVQAQAGGLIVGYPSELKVEADDFSYPHQPDLLLGVKRLEAKETLVAAYSDWTVTAHWQSGDRQMRATIGHGLPFAYVTDIKGGDALITPQHESAKLTHREGSTACYQVRSNHYCAFSPLGTEWKTLDNKSIYAIGAEYYSVAALPDGEEKTRELFEQHAYAFVTGSKVTWKYNRKNATMDATYALEVDFKAGSAPASAPLEEVAPSKKPEPAPASDQGAKVSQQDFEAEEEAPEPEVIEPPVEYSKEPLMALYRHQYVHTKDQLLKQTYVSPRGAMKIRASGSFTTQHPAGTLLPGLPDGGNYDRGKLKGFVKIAAGQESFRLGAEGTRDSYWEGKSFGRTASSILIADQMGLTGRRDKLIDDVKSELEDWFDGQGPRLYFYDNQWKTLIGTPTMYHSGVMMNDHHFHYAYYIHAAAIVALYDQEWAKKVQPMVEMLIRDAGNWKRDDKMFPFMRYFDQYAGHSWASGTVMSDRGNNEESSSEDVNFAAALAIWGEVMNRPEIRDAGMYMHATLQSSISQYWYDVDGEVYPEGFKHPGIGINWGNGGAYTTWFSYQPVFIHGIQLTPMNGGLLFLGKNPEKVNAIMAHATKGNEGEIRLWRDMFWKYGALGDPARSVKWFQEEHWYEPEFGSTMAHLYHYIHNLDAMGQVHSDVTADTPLFAVFKKGETVTHVAYNATAKPQKVTFSDGTVLNVAPRSFAISGAKE